MFMAKVKYNGNHYFAGQIVRGSSFEMKANGKCFLFDDEPIPYAPYYGESREEWVEVDPITLKEV